jgi:hypothetical protein
VFSYKHSSGNYVLMRVVGHGVDNGGRRPHCELLDFFDKTIPVSTSALEEMPFVTFSKGTRTLPLPITLMTIGDISKKFEPGDKVQLVAKSIQVQQIDKGPWKGFFWRDFDQRITDLFIEKKSSS